MDLIIDEGGHGEKHSKLSRIERERLVLLNIDDSVISIEIKKIPFEDMRSNTGVDSSN
jgi:hypothetical protein